MPSKVKKVKAKCAEYWRQADNWANANGYGPLKKIIDQVHVVQYGSKIICYKEEDIWINGWCNTDGVNYAGTKGWGICSESCKFLKLQYDKEQNPDEFKEVYSDSTQIIFSMLFRFLH